MEWLKYVFFAIFIVIALVCWYFSWRFYQCRLTEREINLYNRWFVRIWYRYRIAFTMMFGVVFALMGIASFFFK